MRMRNKLLLTIIQLVILLRANDGAVNNCLIRHENNSCSCCKSGYRSQTCSEICQHCLTRNVPGGQCTYYCETGYYGKTCDKECPHTCAAGNNGPNLCKVKYGLPVCVKCIPGYFGKQCDQTCDTNCLNRTCYQTDGKCLSCRTNEFYGDHCRLPCNQGCVSGTCNRTGHCTHGCKFGFYGRRCRSTCGSNCKQGKCTSHGYHAYNCTEGCHGGYWGTPCLEKCPNHCTECEQQSGRCTLCIENYVQETEYGECVKVRNTVAVSTLVAIIIGLIVVICAMISVIIWMKRRPGSSNTNVEECVRLIPTTDISEGSGVNVEAFLKPKYLDKIIAILKNYQLILVQSNAGEGKTVVCQLLIHYYRSEQVSIKLGNSLKDLTYVLNQCDPIVVFFDDAFGKNYCEFQMTPDVEQCLDILKTKGHIKVVLTSRIDVYTDAQNYLGRFRSLFNYENTFTLSLDNDDKQKMLSQYLMKCGKYFPEEYISNVTNTEPTYGFPHSCQMYSSLQYHDPDLELLDFFKETHTILVSLFEEMLKDKVKKFVLFLLLAGNGSLDLKMLIHKSGTLYTKVSTYLEPCSVDELKDAMSNMPDFILARSGDIVEFKHQSLYDVSLIAISNIDIQFILKFGPLSCLENKVWQHKSLSFNDNTDLAKRFADELKEDTAPEVCRHSFLEKELFVQNMLKYMDKQTLTSLVLEEDLMYWMSNNKSDALTKEILQRHQNPNFEQKQRAILGICRFGNVKALDYLIHIWGLDETSGFFDLCENSIPCLIVAANQNHEEVVKKLITLGVNPNICDILTGSSAVHWSAAAGHSAIIDVLLESGCLVNSLNQGHATPLFLAAANGHLHSVETLCKRGADVNIQIRSRLISLDSRLTPGSATIKQIRDSFKDFSPLHVACYEGHTTIVEHLLNQGANVNQIITQGSPIELAAKMNHLQIFSLLLNQKKINHSYAISGAFEFGRSEKIKEFLNQRCYEELVSIKLSFEGDLKALESALATNRTLLNKDIHGFGCLHFASLGGHHHVVEFLLRQDMNVNSASAHIGLNALHCAAITDQELVVRKLLDSNMDVNTTCRSGNTALHFAAWNGHTKTVETLLEHKHIGTNMKGQWKQTALHLACVKNHLQVAKTLLNKGAIIDKLSDDLGSPLAFAIYEGNKQIADYLIDAEACINPERLAFSPLIAASASGQTEMIQFLLEKGANVNHTGKIGFSILHFLTWMGSMNVLQFLVNNYKSDLKMNILAFVNKSKDEKYAAFYAIREWCKRTAGRDVNLECYELGTALHVATDLGYTDIIKFLIDNGASLEIKNKNKQLPKDIAEANGDERVIACFE